MGLSHKKCHRGKNEGKQDKEKTETDDAGMDDEGRIQKTQRRQRTRRRLESLLT